MEIQILAILYRFEFNPKSHREIPFIQVPLNVLKINTLEIAMQPTRVDYGKQNCNRIASFCFKNVCLMMPGVLACSVYAVAWF
jgi:hypothetical protein